MFVFIDSLVYLTYLCCLEITSGLKTGDWLQPRVLYTVYGHYSRPLLSYFPDSPTHLHTCPSLSHHLISHFVLCFSLFELPLFQIVWLALPDNKPELVLVIFHGWSILQEIKNQVETVNYLSVRVIQTIRPLIDPSNTRCSITSQGCRTRRKSRRCTVYTYTEGKKENVDACTQTHSVNAIKISK